MVSLCIIHNFSLATALAALRFDTYSVSVQDELRAARAQETELSEKLGVVHSQLEAQLLTNLEQEEEIRCCIQVLHCDICCANGLIKYV